MTVLRVSCLNDAKLPPNLFYPFGTDVGDHVVPRQDDASAGPVLLAVAFPFYNTSYGRLYVSEHSFQFLSADSTNDSAHTCVITASLASQVTDKIWIETSSGNVKFATSCP